MKITIQNEGTICLLDPKDESAAQWLRDNLDPAGITWGPAHVVEPRYVDAIVAGFVAAGGEVVQ